MTLTVTAIGVLTKDPFGKENYTMWKVRSFGKEITLFSSDNAMTARMEYQSGMRIRGEGRGGWNEFNESYALQLSQSAIDGSNAEDDLKIKVDGVINHELKVEFDDEDEGGGKYIPVEIEASVRGKNNAGEWDDIIAYVRAMIIGKGVEQLLELDKKGVTALCFTGSLDAEPCFINGEVGYYAEITNVELSMGRGGSDDGFWSSKPKGLANRKGAPVKSAPAARKPGEKPKGISDDGPDDALPF